MNINRNPTASPREALLCIPTGPSAFLYCSKWTRNYGLQPSLGWAAPFTQMNCLLCYSRGLQPGVKTVRLSRSDHKLSNSK